MRTRFASLRLEVDKDLPSAIDMPDILFDAGGLHDAPQEVFWVMPYDSIMQVRTIVEIARGGYHSVEIPIPAILSAVFVAGTDRFIVGHNHSTGDVTPTTIDVDLTAKVMAAANTCGLYFEDHIIVGPNKELFSFAETGLLVPSPQLQAMARGQKRAKIR